MEGAPFRLGETIVCVHSWPMNLRAGELYKVRHTHIIHPNGEEPYWAVKIEGSVFSWAASYFGTLSKVTRFERIREEDDTI